jgi:hypothetical protein
MSPSTLAALLRKLAYGVRQSAAIALLPQIVKERVGSGRFLFQYRFIGVQRAFHAG